MTEEIKIDEILAEANRVINGERRDQYGNAEDSFDLIAIYWNAYIKKEFIKWLDGYVLEWYDSYDDSKDLIKLRERIIYDWFDREELGDFVLNKHDVDMMMILLKVARTQGGEKKKDNYVDIAGYAALAARM